MDRSGGNGGHSTRYCLLLRMRIERSLKSKQNIYIFLDSDITLIQMNFDITRLSLVVVERGVIYLLNQLEEGKSS